MLENTTKDFSTDLIKILCPTYLMFARYDELIPFTYATIFQDLIPFSKLIPIKGPA